MLMNRGRGGFEVVEKHDRFFRSNELAARGSAELADDLLIILHVQGVLRLELRQLLIQIAGAGQISGLDAGVGQQFHDFADVRVLSGLVEQVEQFLQRVGIIPNMPDDGVQAVENLAGIFRQQALGVLIVNLQCVLVLTGLHQRVGESGDGRQIVVDGQQLVGDRSGIGKLSGDAGTP